MKEKVKKEGEKVEEVKTEKAGLIQPVPEDITSLTVREAIERGYMPISPVEMAGSSEEIAEMSKQVGTVHGSALHAIISAVKRTDLPLPVRLAKFAKGASALIGSLMTAADTAKTLDMIESRVLTEKRIRTSKSSKAKAKEKDKTEEAGDIDDLLDRLEEMVKRQQQR